MVESFSPKGCKPLLKSLPDSYSCFYFLSWLTRGQSLYQQIYSPFFKVFPGGLDGKESACNAGDSQSLAQEDPLEKEMATYSRILVWQILWTEEPGRLQSMGLQRLRQD